jgi:outer membrane receptor for ferrienterochelin and colicins
MQQMIKTFSTILLFSITNSAFSQDTARLKFLDEIVITGQPKPQSLKNSVYQLKVINSERIKLSGATNVQQVLNNQLGFRFSNDNTLGITDVQINGMSGRNVKILLDGVPLIDRSDERASLSQIDINTIERIEIIEGPMSVSFGTDAMAGVINIISKRNDTHTLSISAKTQEETAGKEYYPFSYKGVHTQNLNIATNKNNFSFNAGATHYAFDGFGGDKYGRGKSWLPKEQFLGNGKIGYKKNKLNIYYRFDGMTETIRKRNPINIDLDVRLAKSIDQRFVSNRLMHQIQSNYRFNENINLASSLAYTNFKRTTSTDYHDFITGIITPGNLDGQQDVSKLNAINFKNTLQYSVSSKLSFQPGLEINHEKASGERIVSSPFINDYAVFISTEYKPTAKINIRPGIRFQSNSTYKSPPIIPSINTKFSINKNVDIRLSYGTGFRAPVLRELFFRFVDVNHNIVGNPNLKAENSNSFNGSVHWNIVNTNNIKVSSIAIGFYNVFRNQITLIENINVPTQFSYFNIDLVKTKGVSVDNKIAYKNLNASVGLNYTGFKRKYDVSLYKNIKEVFLWTPELNANIIYKLSNLNSSFALFYKFVGTKPDLRNDPTGREPGLFPTSTNAYHLADFTITTILNKNLTINTGVKNLFDVTAVNSTTIVSSSVSHNTAGALSVNYGRSYFVGLNFQWNKK